MVLLGLSVLALVGALASVPRAQAATCDWYCDNDGHVVCPCDPRLCRNIQGGC
jgi:hypothetical protein